MTFYFYTKHRKACKKITKALEENGHTCNTYINSDEFYKSILKIKTCPDLLLIDYLTYDHSIFNIYRYMHDIGCSIPLLFYNSPFPKDADSRLKHWIMALNLHYGHIGSLDIDSLFPPLKTIAETIEAHGKKRIYRSIAYREHPVFQKTKKIGRGRKRFLPYTRNNSPLRSFPCSKSCLRMKAGR